MPEDQYAFRIGESVSITADERMAEQLRGRPAEIAVRGIEVDDDTGERARVYAADVELADGSTRANTAVVTARFRRAATVAVKA